MADTKLDEKKLKMIKVKVIEIEKDNIIQKDSNDDIVKKIRNYVEKVVDSTC